MNTEKRVLIGLLLLGIGLRFIWLGHPDFSTDEAQFALGASAAQPPLGIGLLRIFQMILGHEIVIARLVSVIAGIVSIGLVYLTTKEISNDRSALIAATTASLFPSHILFSRLAYLSVLQSCAWLLLIYVYLRVTRETKPWLLLMLYLSVIIATFTKTQGLLLPALLIIHRMFVCRWSSVKDEVIQILVLGLIPVTLYIGTTPGILATVALYGGDMYGISELAQRITTLWSLWMSIAPLFIFAFALSARSWKVVPAPVWLLTLVASSIGLILGPSHAYYTSHLVVWAIPIGIALSALQPRALMISVIVLALSSMAVVGPVITPVTYALYREPNYWNTHADAINAVLPDEPVITVGDAGHHIRWYIERRVKVGSEELLEGDGVFLILDHSQMDGETLYDDGTVSVVRK